MKKERFLSKYLSNKTFATSEFDFSPWRSLKEFQRSISSPMLILARLLFLSKSFFFLFFAESVRLWGLPGRRFTASFPSDILDPNKLAATAQNLGSNDRTKGHMHITENSDSFMRDVNNYLAPRCVEIFSFYRINIYNIWLNRFYFDTVRSR